MRQSVSWFVVGLLVPASFAVTVVDAMAHQDLAIGDVNVTAHLEPDDSPRAGEPSLTWFHLTRSDGETISLSDCACDLVVYDSQNQVIAHPQLSESEVEGHERPITTNITFPNPGNYQLVFTGQPVAEKFAPFEITVPVTVRP